LHRYLTANADALRKSRFSPADAAAFAETVFEDSLYPATLISITSCARIAPDVLTSDEYRKLPGCWRPGSFEETLGPDVSSAIATGIGNI
jgi:hypothetical protein